MATALEIQPSSFIASEGKLDSSKRYIYETTSENSSFVLPVGRTIDLPLRGVVYEIDGYKFVSGTTSSFTSNFVESTV